MKKRIYNIMIIKFILVYVVPAFGIIQIFKGPEPSSFRILAILFLLLCVRNWIIDIFQVVNTDGEIIIDTSNPEKDIYRLQLNGPVEDLHTKRAVTFKVVNNSSSRMKNKEYNEKI